MTAPVMMRTQLPLPTVPSQGWPAKTVASTGIDKAVPLASSAPSNA